MIMNRLSLISIALLSLVGLAGCDTDRTPVFVPAASSSFEMNEPVFADQYYELSEEGTFQLTCKSQPDYGAPIAPITYGVEVSLDGNFDNPDKVREIKASTATSVMTISEKKLTQAICALKGYTEKDEGNVTFTAIPVYFRGVCYPNAPDQEFNAANRVVTSNVVKLNKVMPYFSLAKPGYIYLIGQPAVGNPFDDWFAPMEDNANIYESWKMYEKEDQIESKIYYGEFEIPEGCALFRFYTALTGWDADSYGPQADDNPVVCNWEDREFSVTKGKGSYDFSSWPGGKMYLRVNMNDMTLTVSNSEIKDE